MSVNKAILVGRLGQDPDDGVNPETQAPRCNISVATDSSYKNKSGEKVDKTEWHRVVFFGNLAEIANQYLKKGSQVFVEGRIETTKYEKDGQDKYSTSIVASEMRMLGSKNDTSSGSDSDDSFNQQKSQSSNEPTKAPSPAVESFEQLEDDIPF